MRHFLFISSLKNDKSRLIQLSFLMLFVELTLIRWVGSNIYYLFFFSNFILLASFLGIGIGFLRTKKTVNLFRFSPILLALIIILSYRYSHQYHAQVDPETDNLNYLATYYKNNLYPVWITLPIIFLLVVILMTAIADGVSRTFQKFSPLQAYRWEVLGSLIGVIAFSLLSFLNTNPLIWGLVICLLYLSLLREEWQARRYWIMILQISMLIAMMATFAKDASMPQHFWSSYYKIDLQEYAGKRYVVNVNGLAQQIIESVEQRKRVKPFYFQPYQHAQKNALTNVLVIGSGTGGDVAIALKQGAKHVDAVEIDPMLYRLGQKFNPNQPYHDPRVRIIINDGRAFLQQSTHKYDMIIFALTDSLMLIPGQSSLRLENYLYTLEGLTAASKLLKPDGVFTIYNYYEENWFIDRLANTLAIIYKHAPCIDTYSPKDYWATVLSISPTQSALQCNTLWQSLTNNYQAPSTDNHPFIYLQENTIPTLYVLTLFFMLFASLGSIKLMGASYSSIKNYLDLFFMGAAFLLLETKSIINFALLFGTTWIVNALVFIGILSIVYLSVEITSRTNFSKRWYLYAGLIFSLFLSWVIPNEYLLLLSIPLRFIAATLLAFLPILIANLIFADRFRSTMHSTEAFGANLIGAMIGGSLEYTSLIIGYHNLLLLIIFLYTLAILLMTFTKNKMEIKPVH